MPKSKIIIFVSLSSILLLGFLIYQNMSQPTKIVEKPRVVITKPDCSLINNINSKAVNQNISKKTIDGYFNTGYEYTNKVPIEDKKFAISNIYSLINNESQMLEIYSKALECKDKRIVRLLSEMGIPAGGQMKYFEERLEMTWSKLEGKKIQLRKCVPECFNGETKYYFELDDKQYTLIVLPIDDVQGFKVPKVIVGSVIEARY